MNNLSKFHIDTLTSEEVTLHLSPPFPYIFLLREEFKANYLKTFFSGMDFAIHVLTKLKIQTNISIQKIVLNFFEKYEISNLLKLKSIKTLLYEIP